MAKTADVVIDFSDLLDDLVRRSRHHQAGFDSVFDGRAFAKMAERVHPAAHDVNRGADRNVARRIGEVRYDLVGGDVPHQLFGAVAGFGFARRGIDERGVGQPIKRHGVAAARFAPTLPIGIENPAGAIVAGEESRLHKAPRADACRTAWTGGAHPNRRMRLLVRPRPDVDHAVVKEPALMTYRTVMSRPGLDDEIERFPVPLVHAYRIAVRGCDLPRHTAHEAHFHTAAR